MQEISIEAAQPGLDLGVLKELPNKRIALGVLDHSTTEAESVDVVAQRDSRGAAVRISGEAHARRRIAA